MAIELPRAISKAAWQWEGGASIPLRLPNPAESGVEQTAALIAIPNALGIKSGHLQLDEQRVDLSVRIVDAKSGPLPHARLVDGHPVDASGTPIILSIPEDKGSGDRRWWALRSPLPRGSGKPVFIGDPLASLGQTVLPDELQRYEQVLFDEPYPDNAGLVAWAQVAATQPRT